MPHFIRLFGAVFEPLFNVFIKLFLIILIFKNIEFFLKKIEQDFIQLFFF